MQQCLNRHWVAGALCTAILLALLVPILAQHWPSAWLLIFAVLPAYMFSTYVGVVAFPGNDYRFSPKLRIVALLD